MRCSGEKVNEGNNDDTMVGRVRAGGFFLLLSTDSSYYSPNLGTLFPITTVSVTFNAFSFVSLFSYHFLF